MSHPGADSRFEEIYNSTQKAALAYIASKCRRTADISDIFQETYLELYRVLQKRGEGYVTDEKAFVLTLAKQKLARHYTLFQRLRAFEDTGDNDNEEAAIADDFATEEFAVNQVMLDEARRFIRTRAEPVQKVFFLFYEAGLTIPEISGMLNISESNVKNKLYRTLKELRKILT